MEFNAPVRFDDLLSAFEWVSSGALADNSAYVSRKTGATHWASDFNDVEDELPQDVDDASIVSRYRTRTISIWAGTWR